MKHPYLVKMTQAFRTGFPVGAMLALFVYAFARILFYEFTFTAWEEIVNFLQIIAAGGLMVSLAIISFLSLEMGLQFLMNLSVSVPSFRWRRSDDLEEAVEYPMEVGMGA